VPAKPLYDEISDIIGQFAAAHSAVCFEPHVTIYSGPSDDTEASNILQALGQTFRAITLNPSKVGVGVCITKLLFIEFGESQALRAMLEIAKGRSAQPQEFVLKPHMSLLYANPSEVDLVRLSCDLTIPKGPYVFDHVKIIETEIPVTSNETIEGWRIVGECVLGG